MTQKQTPLSFKSAKDLYNRVLSMEGAPMWKAKEITLDDAPDEPQILFYRDIEECCDHLQGNPSFSDAWDTAPKKVKYSGTQTRIYHDPSTADLWWTYQANIGCLYLTCLFSQMADIF